MIKVLIAEDHPIMRDLLRRALEKPGDMEVVAVERNGEKAVNKAILHHPDVAVIDIGIPIMDGVKATKELLEHSPETRVLICSGHNAPEYIKKSLEAGAFGYILKDFISQDLIAGVRAVYEGRPYFSQQIIEIATRYLEGGGSGE